MMLTDLLFPLPGYAHGLNPVEQSVGKVKSNELANLCSDTIAEAADVAGVRQRFLHF